MWSCHHEVLEDAPEHRLTIAYPQGPKPKTMRKLSHQEIRKRGQCDSRAHIYPYRTHEIGIVTYRSLRGLWVEITV